MSKRKTPPETEAQNNSSKKSALGNNKPAHFLRDDFINLYIKCKDDPIKRQELFQSAISEENYYREIFAQDRDNEILNDEHLFMINTLENRIIFEHIKESEEELKLPRLRSNTTKIGGNSIVTREQFLLNFDLFTEYQLADLDWSNILVAGGSVLACLQEVPAPHNASNIAIRNYYHKIAYQNSDIDIFIYGLSPDDANKKMESIYETIKNNIVGADDVVAFRSLHAVTIISKYPYRHIQIVLRLYKSPAEVLMGFDVDCCAVGFDGKNVWASPRAHHALTYQLNTVDMTRRSPSYEMRLAKYCTRGFGVLLPGLEEERIDPSIYEKRFDQVQGLAKLLLLIKLDKPSFRHRYKEQQRLRKLRPEYDGPTDVMATFVDTDNDDANIERLNGGESASDYSTVFLPWGPTWHARRIRKLMYTKDLILNSKWYDPKKVYHTHPCFFGTISEIIKDCCGNCPEIPECDKDPDSPFVSGSLTWMEINPGKQTQIQRIGSFHPITEGDWTEGAYISTSTDFLFSAVISNNDVTLSSLLNEKDVNVRDPTGRTLLHVATISNSTKAAEILIKKGARISSRMIDGRTALHLAAQYNSVDILQLLIERGAELEDIQLRKQQISNNIIDETKKKKKSKEDEDEDEDEEENEDDDEEMKEDEEVDLRDVYYNAISGEGNGPSIKDIKDKMMKEKLEKLVDPTAEKGDDFMDINLEDWDYHLSALDYAAYFGNNEIIKILIEEGGADIKRLSRKNEFSVLTFAIFNNYPSTVKLLLSLGFPIQHLTTKKNNALHILAKLRSPSIEIAQILIDYKIDINAPNESFKTPLLIRLENLEEKYRSSSYLRSLRKKQKKINMNLEIISERSYKFIEFLVKNGAKVHFTGKEIIELKEKSSKKKTRKNYSEDEEEEDDMDEDEDEVGDDDEDISPKKRVKKGDLEDKYLREESKFNSALQIALKLQSIRLIELFLKHGANINQVMKYNYDRYQTPLDFIQKRLRYLLKQSANLDDNYDRGAFMESDNDVDGDEEEVEKKSENLIDKSKKILKEINNQFQNANKKTLAKNIFLFAYELEMKEIKMITKNQQSESDDKLRKLFYSISLMKLDKERLEQIQKILIKNEAKEFILMKFPKNSIFDLEQTKIKKKKEKKEEKEKSPTRKHKKEKKNKEKIKYKFKHMDAIHPDPTLPNQITKYENLYKSIIDDDLNGIDKATIKIKKGVPAIVCSILSIKINHNKFKYNPLHIAMQLNRADTLRLLLSISQSQFTPKIKKEDEKRAMMNNYSLTKMMQQGIKMKHYLNEDGLLDEDEEENKVDPNSSTNFISFAGTRELITNNLIDYFGIHKEIYNIFHIAAYYNSVDACKALIQYIEANIEFPNDFIQTELHLSTHGFTPFNLAIARENFEIAELLLQYGAGIKADYNDYEYEGLDVGGKKMDWVKDHFVTQKKNISPLMVAARLGKINSLEFLVKKAPSIWKNYFYKIYPDTLDDEFVSPSEFNLRYCDYKKGTPLQVATPDAARKILELNSELVDDYNREGMTALQRACHFGNLKKAEILLENGASITKQSKKGWNALHFAASNGDKKTLLFLLNECTKHEINLKTREWQETPLFIACSKSRHKFVKLLLENGADHLIADITGDLPLHAAVKARDLKTVNILLKSIAQEYYGENGVGMTPIDCAIAKMIEAVTFPITSNLNVRNQQVLNELLENLKNHPRVKASNSHIRNVTEKMLQQAIDDVKTKKTFVEISGEKGDYDLVDGLPVFGLDWSANTLDNNLDQFFGKFVVHSFDDVPNVSQSIREESDDDDDDGIDGDLDD